ncbi:MAG: TolC family protein [bacterium]
MSNVAPGCARIAATILAGLCVAAPCVAEPLTLAECTKLALSHNLEAEQARGDLQAAQAGVLGAQSAFLPHVSASGDWSRSSSKIVSVDAGLRNFDDRLWRFRAGASLTLFDGFANWYGYREATGARTAAGDRYLKARQDVVSETERRFFEVRRQDALLEVQKKAVELAQEQLKKTTAMKDLGAATQADVYKAQVAQSNSQVTELRTERDLQVAQSSLSSYLGKDPREELSLAPEEPTLEQTPDLAAAMDQALKVNPSLTAARASLQASESGLRVAKAARMPSLSLSGARSYQNGQFDGLFDDVNGTSTVALSMDFTVFDGLLTKSQIHRAEADLLKAQRAAESAERDVVLAVRTAWLDLEIARRQIDVAQEGVRSSEEDQRLAEERYRLGEGTILDVIDAQVNLTRSRTDLENARFDARLALSALKSAVGDLAVPGTGQ